MLQTMKSIWRTVVPETIRSSDAVTRFKTRFLPHNWIYDQEYYQTEVDTAALESAPAMVASLIEVFAPRKVVDVGCGTGALAVKMMGQGVEVHGLEYADSAIAMCRDRGVAVRKFDIDTSGGAPEDLRDADLVVSFEVAEHLPEEIADKYVALLTSMAPNVLISAAPPGQGGTDHVNEQPKEYWVAKFRENGFDIDEVMTTRIQQAFEQSGSVVIFYWKNTLVFSRA